MQTLRTFATYALGHLAMSTSGVLPSLPAKRQHATLAAHAQESAADLAMLAGRLRDEGEYAAARYAQRRAAARYANARELVANCSE